MAQCAAEAVDMSLTAFVLQSELTRLVPSISGNYDLKQAFAWHRFQRIDGLIQRFGGKSDQGGQR